MTAQNPLKPAEPFVVCVKKSTLEAEKRVVLQEDPFSTDSVKVVGCGSPFPTFEVLVVDPATKTCLPDNRVGEAWIQGPSVAQGYWGRPELNEEMFGVTLQYE